MAILFSLARPSLMSGRQSPALSAGAPSCGAAFDEIEERLRLDRLSEKSGRPRSYRALAPRFLWMARDQNDLWRIGHGDHAFRQVDAGQTGHLDVAYDAAAAGTFG